MTGLLVGEVARQAGVNLQTVHYYERRGLLPKPPRTNSNYRAYPDDAVLRVRFVKRAQELGFTLKEIGELLSLRAKPGARGVDVYRRAEEKIREIDLKVLTLQAMRKALSKLMSECVTRRPGSECPILEALDSEGKPRAPVAARREQAKKR
jgi:MerR family mercuric resistance operon transcriptional regulator